jgi:MarR family multiple antibiotic resistance transcriptional regulator
MAHFDPDDFPPHNSLGHLIHLLNQHKNRLLDRHLEPYDVTSAQFKVMLLMVRDGVDTSSDLCRLLSISSGAMTRMLDRLEHKGLLVRTSDASDRRQLRLELTEQGRAFSAQITRIAVNALNDLASPLSEAELDEFQHLLRKMLAPSGVAIEGGCSS